jgi:hypothetical protein
VALERAEKPPAGCGKTLPLGEAALQRCVKRFVSCSGFSAEPIPDESARLLPICFFTSRYRLPPRQNTIADSIAVEAYW